MMRWHLLLILALPLTPGCTSRPSQTNPAGEEPVLSAEPTARPGTELDARRILNRALEAHGGENRLLKLDTGRATWTMNQTLADHGEDDLTIEETFQLPRQLKRVIWGKSAGKQVAITWAIEGGKCWYLEAGQEIRELKSPPDADSNPGPLRPLRWLREIAEQNPRLALVEQVQEGTQTLQGVQLAIGNRPAEHAYFDKATGLLARYRNKRRVPRTAPTESVMESRFSDFREVDGITIPMKLVILQDNKQILEARVLKVEFLNEIEDQVFARP